MSIFTLQSLAAFHLSLRKGSIASRGTTIITQKENKGEYGSEWLWSENDIYAHAVDQNGPNGSDGTPYRYLSAMNFGDNACTDSTQTTNGKTAYSNISGQISCSPNTHNAGNWYSFPAATAGSDMSHLGIGYHNYTETPNSICPKGWRLSGYSGNKSYQNLIRDIYQITDGPSDFMDANLLDNSAMSFIRLGYYPGDVDGALSVRGSAGLYWSSVAHDVTGSTYLFFIARALNPTEGSTRNVGMSIRCVSR